MQRSERRDQNAAITPGVCSIQSTPVFPSGPCKTDINRERSILSVMEDGGDQDSGQEDRTEDEQGEKNPKPKRDFVIPFPGELDFVLRFGR